MKSNFYNTPGRIEVGRELKISTKLQAPSSKETPNQHETDLELGAWSFSGASRKSRAFSLIEIMVTVALLSFIVLGLLAMFTQTKRAFVSSMTQQDVMEVGRAMFDSMVREFEQMTPSHNPPPPGNRNYLTTNFFAELCPGFNKAPLYQGLTGTEPKGPGLPQDRRTNVVQRVFFLSQVNQDWIGTGYQVLADDPGTGGVGTLFRYSRTVKSRGDAALLSSNFLYAFGPNGSLSNLSRIADGVVHFRVRPYATNGFPVEQRGFLAGPAGSFATITNTFLYMNTFVPGQEETYFVSNAVPAYVELELGILEPRVLERFRAMVGYRTQQLQYLSNHVAQVHLFRQRIPIRNVDFSPYQ